MACEAELCPSWTGNGCICAVLDLKPGHDARCDRDLCHPDCPIRRKRREES